MKKIIIISAFIFFFTIKDVIAANIPGVQTPIPINPQGSGNCPNSYYTYQQPLKSGAPTLADLFDGTAHFQTLEESQIVNINFNPAQVVTSYAKGQPSKMPILFNPADNQYPYYSYTRAYSQNGHFNMYLLKSSDGFNFSQVAPIFSNEVINEIGDIYDGHLSIDYSVCPTKYYLALECSGSLCISYSTDPFNPSSWSKPVTVVSYDTDGHKSASTGVFLIDGINKYVSWTVVDDGPLGLSKDHDTGIESTYSRAIGTNNFLSYLGNANIGSIVMPAEQNTHCTSSWDCNNRDKQDWKKEGNYYYLIYNGANYYRCIRFPGDSDTNDWGNGIVRSLSPLAGYDLTGVGKITQSQDKSLCAVSYPLINAVGGELYMYYIYDNVPNDTGPRMVSVRSKLVWNPSFTPTPTPIPGDLNHDGVVNIQDYNQLVSDFGKTGSPGWILSDINKDGKVDIFDYNILVGNWGKTQ